MTQVTATIVDGERTEDVAARLADGALLIEASDLERATGWHLEPEGLCRAEACVPVRDRAALEVDGAIALSAFAELLARPLAVETDTPPIAVLGEPLDTHQRMRGRDAPRFTLPDVDGRPVALDDYVGRKRMLIAWASW